MTIFYNYRYPSVGPTFFWSMSKWEDLSIRLGTRKLSANGKAPWTCRSTLPACFHISLFQNRRRVTTPGLIKNSSVPLRRTMECILLSRGVGLCQLQQERCLKLECLKAYSATYGCKQFIPFPLFVSVYAILAFHNCVLLQWYVAYCT